MPFPEDEVTDADVDELEARAAEARERSLWARRTTLRNIFSRLGITAESFQILHTQLRAAQDGYNEGPKPVDTDDLDPGESLLDRGVLYRANQEHFARQRIEIGGELRGLEQAYFGLRQLRYPLGRPKDEPEEGRWPTTLADAYHELREVEADLAALRTPPSGEDPIIAGLVGTEKLRMEQLSRERGPGSVFITRAPAESPEEALPTAADDLGESFDVPTLDFSSFGGEISVLLEDDQIPTTVDDLRQFLEQRAPEGDVNQVYGAFQSDEPQGFDALGAGDRAMITAILLNTLRQGDVMRDLRLVMARINTVIPKAPQS